VKRCIIKDRKHPWYGETGELTNEELPTGQLVMNLDNGMHSGVYLRQVEML